MRGRGNVKRLLQDMSVLSRVWLFATPCTITRQAPLSVGFSRQEYWCGLPCLPQVSFPTQGSNPSLSCYHWATWDALPNRWSFDWGDERLQSYTEGGVSQHFVCTKCHWTVHFILIFFTFIESLLKAHLQGILFDGLGSEKEFNGLTGKWETQMKNKTRPYFTNLGDKE